MGLLQDGDCEDGVFIISHQHLHYMPSPNVRINMFYVSFGLVHSFIQKKEIKKLWTYSNRPIMLCQLYTPKK